MNLPAGSGVGDTDGSQFNDILVVVVAGPGSLPVNDRGAHGFLFGSPAGQARASFLHPALALGESNTDVGIMDGYEVLLQYDWCGVPMTGSNLRPVAPANPQTACAGQGPGVAPVGTAPSTPTPAAAAPSPLRFLAALTTVREGVAALRLRCALTTTCAGTLLLRPRGGAAARGAAAAEELRQRALPDRREALRDAEAEALEGGRSALRRELACPRRGARHLRRRDVAPEAHAEARVASPPGLQPAGWACAHAAIALESPIDLAVVGDQQRHPRLAAQRA